MDDFTRGRVKQSSHHLVNMWLMTRLTPFG
jgi:hypothetical protein